METSDIASTSEETQATVDGIDYNDTYGFDRDFEPEKVLGRNWFL